MTRRKWVFTLAAGLSAAERKTTPGFALMGGGKDQDEAFRWLIGKAGGGEFVVIRASGTDAYNKYVLGLGAQAAETLVIRTPEAARDPSNAARIRNAGALFIAGGDQWNYVRLWNRTPISEAIQELIDRGVPVGGSSAGLAVLGQYIFTAEKDTVTSAQALANPFDERVTVGTDFLRIPLLAGVITDTHFSRRDRMGRTLVFLARILAAGKTRPARAIAADERTAALVEAGGAVSITGEGAVYFLHVARPAAVCRPGTPLTFGGIAVYRVRAKGSFDVKAWRGAGGDAYTLAAENGAVRSTQAGGSIY